MDAVIAQKLSGRVENAIKKVLGDAMDEFDAPDFDAVAYVNKHFPDDKSLGALDGTLDKLNVEIQELDESVLETVREQSTSGATAARNIADAKEGITDLQSKIQEIKRKAEASERMVQEICRDIRQLDVAKRHLTHTINTLARLKTLVTAVEELRGHAARRAYFEAAPMLEAAVQLFTHFADYKEAPKVAELALAVERIREELREAVSEDWDVLVDCVTPARLDELPAGGAGARGGAGGSDGLARITDSDLAGEEVGSGETRELTANNVAVLQSACDVIDALGPRVRSSLLKAFMRKQMRPYSKLFGRGGEFADALETVEKRYVWFRRAVREVETRLGKIFPSHWRVPHRLCLEFCEAARGDLERTLSTFDPATVPAEPLLRALMKTTAFEREMSRRYEADLPHYSKAATADAPAPAPADDEGGAFDETAPLYNDRGDLVDPSTAEGIRLKYRRKKEWEERKTREGQRQADMEQRRQWWAALAGVDPSSAGAARGKTDDLATLPRIYDASGASSSASSSAASGGSSSGSSSSTAGVGIISSVFEPYMGAYVRFERANIDALVRQTTAEDMGAVEDKGAASASILRASAQLFLQARNAVGRCCQLNTGGILFALYKEVRDAFQAYGSGLAMQLARPVTAPAAGAPPPKEGTGAWIAAMLGGDTYEVASVPVATPTDPTGMAAALAALDAACLIINTSEYIAETLPALGESIKRAIDPQYRELVVVDALQESFYTLQASAIRVTAGLVTCMLDPCLLAVLKTPWDKMVTVGDQSVYVKEAARILRAALPKARSRLGEGPFRQLCDKFARGFLPRYQTAVFRCKRIGEVGAQQLLMDALGLKDALLHAPAWKVSASGGSEGVSGLGDDDDDTNTFAALAEDDSGGASSSSTAAAGGVPPGVPPVYGKYILREMPRVEMLFKIISSPKDRFADTIKALWPEATAAELSRVIELKGLSKKEAQDVLVALGLAARERTAAPAPGAAGGAPGGSSGAGTGSGSGGIMTGMKEMGAKVKASMGSGSGGGGGEGDRSGGDRGKLSQLAGAMGIKRNKN